MERLRVLHFIYDDTANPWVGGGGAVRVFELYRRLTSQVDATVISGNYPGAQDAERDGVRYRHVGQPRPYAWSRLTYAYAARSWLLEGSYDTAVVDFSGYTPLPVPRDRAVGITVHHLTGPTARERWGKVLGALVAANERWLLRRARWFTATSRATYDVLRSIVARRASISLVQAGVADDLFDLPRRERSYILYFGRLDWYQKGLDTLLSATALLARECPDLELWIAGRGKDAPRVSEEIARLGIGPHVRVIGGVDEAAKRELFSGAQVLLMPSRFEGFGIVAAEAMAAGVPVVAAAAGSLPEVVSPPTGGYLVPPGDAAELARTVLHLLKDRAERERLSWSARQSAERFRWDRIARDHLAFLHDVHRGARAVAR